MVPGIVAPGLATSPAFGSCCHLFTIVFHSVSGTVLLVIPIEPGTGTTAFTLSVPICATCSVLSGLPFASVNLIEPGVVKSTL